MSHSNPISLQISNLSIIPRISIISYLKHSTSMKSEDTHRKLNVFDTQSITEWYAFPYGNSMDQTSLQVVRSMLQLSL